MPATAEGIASRVSVPLCRRKRRRKNDAKNIRSWEQPATRRKPTTERTYLLTFLCSGGISSVRGPAADAPRPSALHDLLRAHERGTPKRVADFTPSEIGAAPARQVLRTRMVEVGDA